MLTLIIALLMNFGVISSPSEYIDATPEQQSAYQQIINDDLGEL